MRFSTPWFPVVPMEWADAEHEPDETLAGQTEGENDASS